MLAGREAVSVQGITCSDGIGTECMGIYKACEVCSGDGEVVTEVSFKKRTHARHW
jgi:hypothetical protein